MKRPIRRMRLLPMQRVCPPPLRRMLIALIAACSCGAAIAAEPAPATCPPIAQAPTEAQIAVAARSARDRGFLWRIVKDGRTSWLYGTLHVARFEWSLPGPTVRAALLAADTLALEIDPLDPQLQRRMSEKMAAAPGSALPGALRARLARAIEAECVPAAAMAAMSPELQVATLATLIGRRDGLDPGYGIDVVLAGFGHAAKRAIVSLESPELQIEAMRGGSSADTEELVDRSLQEIESGHARPILLRTAQVWADGDLRMLAAYESWCECVKTDADRAEMVRMLDDRNPGMAAGIDALHAAGKQVFAAVGSLHMIGPTGLPALMARRGYRVERITYQPRPETP